VDKTIVRALKRFFRLQYKIFNGKLPKPQNSDKKEFGKVAHLFAENEFEKNKIIYHNLGLTKSQVNNFILYMVNPQLVATQDRGDLLTNFEEVLYHYHKSKSDKLWKKRVFVSFMKVFLWKAESIQNFQKMTTHWVKI
jgi:hypothetical protein